MTPVAATLWFEVELFSVVTSTYGFPKHDLTAPIAAADDLARRYRDGTARRLNADGSVDLAVMEGWVRRRFLLYRVRRDGEAALVQTTGAPVAYGLSVAMILGGAAVFAMGTVSRIVRGDAADGVMGLGILGFIVCFVGGIRSNRFGLDWYTRETFGSEAEWQQVFAPTKWAPRRRISCGRSSSLPTSTAARLSRALIRTAGPR